MWHEGLSSLTRDQTQALCIGSMESQPLDHQGSPRIRVIILNEGRTFLSVASGRTNPTHCLHLESEKTFHRLGHQAVEI